MTAATIVPTRLRFGLAALAIGAVSAFVSPARAAPVTAATLPSNSRAMVTFLPGRRQKRAIASIQT